MRKVFIQEHQIEGTKKAKMPDNRKRHVILNFRVTPSEKELIEARIKLSGLSKQEFFIESCLYQKILVKVNVKVIKEIREEISEITTFLKDKGNIGDLSLIQLEKLKEIYEILDAFGEK